MLNFHPHLHCLVTDGCFDKTGTFYQLPSLVAMGMLTELFRHKVLRMLLSKGKMTEALVENLICWPHSGFHVHQGERNESNDKIEQERVAGYILRAPLCQEKIRYLEEKDQVIYWLPSWSTSPTGVNRGSATTVGTVTRAVELGRRLPKIG